MKSLNYKIREYRFRTVMLLALFCCTTVFCYGQDKPKKSDLFYSKIVTLKPGLTKEEVKIIMDEPYKISFTTNNKQEFIEELYYKTSVYIEKWYVITYQCVFVNSKLASLIQNEARFDTPNTEVTISK